MNQHSLLLVYAVGALCLALAWCITVLPRAVAGFAASVAADPAQLISPACFLVAFAAWRRVKSR
jgi:hypothetical protein